MTPFRFEIEFRGDEEDYWRAFFDDDCTREQYELIGMSRFDVLEREDDGDRLTRALYVGPERDFPAIIKKVFGTSSGVHDTTVWYRSEGYAETHVRTDMFASRIDISGRHSVQTVADGVFTRVFEGHISIRIPLVGGRIERIVYNQMKESYKLSSDVTQTWLDRWTLEAP